MKEKIVRLLEFSLIEIKGYQVTVIDVLIVVGILLASRSIVWFVSKLLKRRVFSRLKIDEGRQFAFQQLVKYFTYVAGLLIAFQFMGLDLSLLLAGSAALLVGVGLGLQQTFNDLVRA